MFYECNKKPKTHILQSNITFDELLNAALAGYVGISNKDLTDVKALAKYLSTDKKKFYNNVTSCHLPFLYYYNLFTLVLGR